MTTATMTPPSATEALTPEVAARYHGIDGAIRRKANGTHTPDDALLLDQYNILGDRLKQEIERIQGVDQRQRGAGNPESFAKAQDAHAAEAEAHADAKRKLSPRIEKLKSELADLQQQLREREIAENTAKDKLASMQHNRSMLAKLLPRGLQEMLATLQKPVYRRWQQQIADAEQAYAREFGLVSAGLGGASVAKAQEAEQRVKELKAHRDAEVAEVAPELRDFYFDV